MLFAPTYLRHLVTLLILEAVISVACLIPTPAVAASDEMKAAFVFYLAKFVDWPASAFSGDDAPLVLGVLGEEATKSAFSGLTGKTVKNHPIHVKLLTNADSVAGCHILFIGIPATELPANLATAVQSSATLTVSESLTEFAQHGIVANLIFVDNRIKLELSSGAVRRSGLTISSQVLQLAKVVDADK